MVIGGNGGAAAPLYPAMVGTRASKSNRLFSIRRLFVVGEAPTTAREGACAPHFYRGALRQPPVDERQLAGEDRRERRPGEPLPKAQARLARIGKPEADFERANFDGVTVA